MSNPGLTRRARSLPWAPQQGRIALQPSILAADFARLGDEAAALRAAGIGSLHLDVMDGRFVPNISYGLPVVEAMARIGDMDLDVHLMIVEPERYLDAFAAAGADGLTVHVEAAGHIHRCLERIRELGLRAGVALNPGTPLGAVDEVLELCDQVLVMSVNPGFGGQRFIRSALPKIRRLRRRIDEAGLAVEIQVDGGIAASTVGEVTAAGARWLVAGSALFRPDQPVAETVRVLMSAALAGADAGGGVEGRG